MGGGYYYKTRKNKNRFFFDHVGAKKKLGKKKRRKRISPTAVGDEGSAPSTAPPFGKGGRKLSLPGWVRRAFGTLLIQVLGGSQGASPKEAP